MSGNGFTCSGEIPALDSGGSNVQKAEDGGLSVLKSVQMLAMLLKIYYNSFM